MKDIDRKDIIVEKTFFLLLTKGYDAVSITDIQKETGMSRGLLYHYFGNKEELFRIAGESYLIKLFDTVPNQDLDYGLEEMIPYVVKQYRKMYKSWLNIPNASKIGIANYDFLIYQMISKEKRISDLYNNIRKKELNAWKSAAEKSLAKKEINSVLTPDRIAYHFICLLDGLWLQAVEKDNPGKYLLQLKKILEEYYELLKA